MSTTTKVLFRLLLVAIALPIPPLLFADCPEGVRPTTAAEQSEYLAVLPVLRNALPASPAGLQVKADPLFTTAPNSVCKGSPLVASYGATYTFTDQADRNQASAREHEARIQALQKLSPEEQKQADDLYHQGSQLGYRSIAEQKNHNQAEADRLRAEANKFYAQSKAIQSEHLQKVFPQMKAVLDDQQASYVSPEVRVQTFVRTPATAPKIAAARPVRIEGAKSAYYSDDKTLNVQLGAAPGGQQIWARLNGDKKLLENMARILVSAATHSSGL